MYGFCDIRHGRHCFFFVILGHFLPFDPLNNPKNQNSEKMKKELGDIILHFCTTNGHHMMLGSQYMKCNRIFCHFVSFFPLLPH